MEQLRRVNNMVRVGLFATHEYISLPNTLQRAKEVPVPDIVQQAYEEYYADIQTVYGVDRLRSDLLFHGTGAKQYDKEGLDQANTSGTIKNTLEGIVTHGIYPDTENWVLTPGRQPSTSITRARFYAQYFANMHQTAEHRPLWHYGKGTAWPMFFLLDDMVQEKPRDILVSGHKIRKIRRKAKEDGAYRSNWLRKVRNNVTKKSSTVTALGGESTIPENFGAIIVLSDKTIRLSEIPLFKIYEERTTFPIEPQAILAIETPLSALEQVREMLARANLPQVTVLPMECVDLYLSQFPLVDLTRNQRNYSVADAFKNNRIPVSQEWDLDLVDKEVLLRSSQGDFLTTYRPENILDTLEESLFLLKQFTHENNWEGYTIRSHTLAVMIQFEKYFAHKELPAAVKKDFFRIFLALHDSGKGIAKDIHGRLTQSFYNQKIAERFLQTHGFSYDEVSLAQVLLSDDPLGKYLKKASILSLAAERIPGMSRFLSVNTIRGYLSSLKAETVTKIIQMADKVGMTPVDFLRIVTIFHQSDASSYTTDAGAFGTLDYLFSFDQANSTIDYKEPYKQLVSELHDALMQKPLNLRGDLSK